MKCPWPVVLLALLFALGALMGLVAMAGIFAAAGVWGMLLFSIFPVLYTGIAYGLWMLRNWGRIAAIGMCLFMAIGWAAALIIPRIHGAHSPASGSAGLGLGVVIAALIIGYLCRPSVKTCFSARASN